ncbi:hypothetical protein [Nocardioides stalactiti]|uniref:hypothetical protein n=1 Tax=Nocardioides stalactiti TaxID=2755356 RepID=UPI001C813486|nr:hypothetical protein [Nocardioides stalactiti]
MTKLPIPEPTVTNGMSTIGMPAAATISSVQKSDPSSCSLRSPAGMGWAGR